VLVRDGRTGLETLMLRRDSKVAFGGMWVFPGGRVDERDHDPASPDEQAAARRAASREAAEECGLHVEAHTLVPLAHWVPPAVQPRRFATWFFLARATEGDVVVDGGEIHEHAWLAPGEVIRRRDAGEVDLAPPTWMTLYDLAAHRDVEAALAWARARDPLPRYETHWVTLPDGGAVAMWSGDAGYETHDPELPGPRHRLWLLRDGWRFERADGADQAAHADGADHADHADHAAHAAHADRADHADLPAQQARDSGEGQAVAEG
jgi:8-oxo-dGTP pyrophosphatase MutT (NUDIX family)